MPQVLTKTRTKMIRKKETKETKWHVRRGSAKKQARTGKVTISSRVPFLKKKNKIKKGNFRLEPNDFSVLHMGPSEWETSHSFLFLKMNTENLNAYIIYTRHACMVSLRFTGPGKFVGWETRKGEGNRRRYQGPETGGKPSAAVTQTEQTEGNAPVYKHLSRYVYTEKVISIFALKASRSH